MDTRYYKRKSKSMDDKAIAISIRPSAKKRLDKFIDKQPLASKVVNVVTVAVNEWLDRNEALSRARERY